MKRTKINKSEIILKGAANRVSDKGIAFVVKGYLKLLADRLVWQSAVGEFGKKELTIPIADITDVAVRKPLLLQIWTRSGETLNFIIPIGAGKGRHKEDWERVLREAAANAVIPENVMQTDQGRAVPSLSEEPPSFCAQCGKQLRSGARFCTQCGAAVDGSD